MCKICAQKQIVCLFFGLQNHIISAENGDLGIAQCTVINTACAAKPIKTAQKTSQNYCSKLILLICSLELCLALSTAFSVAICCTLETASRRQFNSYTNSYYRLLYLLNKLAVLQVNNKSDFACFCANNLFITEQQGQEYDIWIHKDNMNDISDSVNGMNG